MRDAADLAEESLTELLFHQMLNPAYVAHTALPGIHLLEREHRPFAERCDDARGHNRIEHTGRDVDARNCLDRTDRGMRDDARRAHLHNRIKELLGILPLVDSIQARQSVEFGELKWREHERISNRNRHCAHGRARRHTRPDQALRKHALTSEFELHQVVRTALHALGHRAHRRVDQVGDALRRRERRLVDHECLRDDRHDRAQVAFHALPAERLPHHLNIARAVGL